MLNNKLISCYLDKYIIRITHTSPNIPLPLLIPLLLKQYRHRKLNYSSRTASQKLPTLILKHPSNLIGYIL